MTKNIKEARSQLKKITNDYYLHLLNEFREMLTDCFAIESDPESAMSLAEDEDWSSNKIKTYNNFIREFWNLLNATKEQDKNALELIENLFLNEYRTSNAQKVIDRIKEIKPLHNATLSFSKIDQTFKKLKAVASLRLIILEENTNYDNKSLSILDAYSQQLKNCSSQIEKHRNPDWDKFYNGVSILPFIAIPRAFYSFFTRGTWNFTLTEGEVMVKNANQLIHDSVKGIEENKDELTSAARLK